MASVYGSLTLNELRTELRKRNAKTSGRKKELVERLESYERNDNFGNRDSICNTKEYSMTLPPVEKYVDVHAEKKIASGNVDIDKVNIYLCQFDKSMDQKPIQMYKEKYLCFMRLCQTDGDTDYIKSACRAEMKKSVTYSVDIAFSKSGHVHEAQCECAAGMGPNAHCKHVSAVLYGCVVFCKTKTVQVEQTCTQKLHPFHHAKRYLGSPLKSRSINAAGADEFTNFEFDPRPEEYRNMQGYQSYFRNICLNFKCISTMPIFQTFLPANNLAVSHDHDYLSETPEDIFLKEIGVKQISDIECQHTEQMTRGQATNKTWQEERLKRIQSSNFGRICKATERTNFVNLAASLLRKRKVTSEAITHGKTYEKDALREYKKQNTCLVKECGVFVSKTNSYLGASPDGIVNESVLCEVKCPFTAKNRPVTTVTVPYLKLRDGHHVLDRNHDYFYQVQGQLFCTGHSFCDFIVYTLVDMKVIRIERDNEFIAEMVKKLEFFYKKFFEPALLEKLFYKSYM